MSGHAVRDAGADRTGHSVLDEAHGHRLRGQRDAALRVCVAMLEREPAHVGAASLALRCLIDAEAAGPVGGEVALRLVDAYVRRGDLPAAVVAASMAAELGEDRAAALGRIAEAFGKGSSRLSDVPPAPPPLPAPLEPRPGLARLSGHALHQRAERALTAFLAAEDPVAADSRLPRLPLFGALEPPALAHLLETFEVREVDAGRTVVEQGSEGHEAFVVARGLLRVTRANEPGEGEATVLAVLGPGAIFGEMALLSDAPRAASVVAIEPSQLLVTGRRALEALAAREPAIGKELGDFCHRRMIANLLRTSRVLQVIGPAERAQLVGQFKACSFDPGERLLERGRESSRLFLVASGSVDVVGRDADGDTLLLATLGPGDVVGEISLVLRRPATADVVARHPTIALTLEREAFHAVIRAHPALLAELYDLATRREEETRSVVAQQAVDVDDAVLL
ncbi:MAG: cyclic nucleotide-binding domain-containing protein [Myxococcota bacterium]|nr:cyclic nucleotide-binding domain-containing protein [Myxococcota bacterium]MDW8360754.1 cyclic nucleotide-binding domain-containing protein [Myxococcales bacterium]